MITIRSKLLCAVFAGVLSTSALAESADALSRLTRIVDLIKSRYVEPVDDGKLFDQAVRGLLKSLDMHSTYLDAESFRKLLQETQGKYGGLGIEVRKDGDTLRILTIFEDTPAHRAGLQAGDLITQLNEDSLAQLTLEQAVKLARGEPYTSLTLTLLRDGEPGPRRLTLDREQIQGRSVRAGMIGSQIAYARLTQFHRHTAEEMALRLERLFESSPNGIEGMILDLRDNPGGTLHSAVAVASAFLPADALVVYTNGMSAESKLKFRARKEDYLRGAGEDYLERLPGVFKTTPLVVLVNHGSASSSEIVAAALQDHKRATIVGTRTYGKGSIQSVVPLGDGSALKLTTAHYFTPKGRSIDKYGIVPDQVIDQEPVVGTDAVSHAVALGRLSLDAVESSVATRVVCRAGLAQRDSNEALPALTPDSSEEVGLADCQLDCALRALEHLTAYRPE